MAALSSTIAAATALAGAGVAVKGQRDAKKAAQNAADDQRRAAIESAEVLGEASREAVGDIQSGEDAAIAAIARGNKKARGYLDPTIDSGQAAFRMADNLSLDGSPLTGPLANSLLDAGNNSINERIYDTSGPVGNELVRQGDINVSGLSKDYIDNLIQHSQLGLAAAGDSSAINSRAGNNIGDIFQQGGSQRASALVGANPQLQQLSESAMDASLLSSAAGQKFKTGAVESLAGLAGQIYGNRG
jgi:hypothetical protein